MPRQSATFISVFRNSISSIMNQIADDYQNRCRRDKSNSGRNSSADKYHTTEICSQSPRPPKGGAAVASVLAIATRRTRRRRMLQRVHLRFFALETRVEIIIILRLFHSVLRRSTGDHATDYGTRNLKGPTLESACDNPTSALVMLSVHTSKAVTGA